MSNTFLGWSFKSQKKTFFEYISRPNMTNIFDIYIRDFCIQSGCCDIRTRRILIPVPPPVSGAQIKTKVYVRWRNIAYCPLLPKQHLQLSFLICFHQKFSQCGNCTRNIILITKIRCTSKKNLRNSNASSQKYSEEYAESIGFS